MIQKDRNVSLRSVTVQSIQDVRVPSMTCSLRRADRPLFVTAGLGGSQVSFASSARLSFNQPDRN